MTAHSGNGQTPGGGPAQARRPRLERGPRIRRWLQPGIGIKRWLFVALLGQLLVALGVTVVVRSILDQAPFNDPGQALFETLTLQFLPPDARPALLLIGGSLLFAYGAWRLLSALVEPYRVPDEPLAELLYQRRLRARGPHVVAIGGGTGLSVLLRGLKELTSNITAVVTVADDGGSSGKLRHELGLPPMGDIRNCLAALAEAEPDMHRLLQYRFPAQASEASSYAGHAFGNLLIAALTGVTGDFEEAVRQTHRVLAVRGTVVPVAGRPITLHAELNDGTQLDGQSIIGRARGIKRIWISPDRIEPAAEALAAIEQAELVVIGPGSLYTSLLPPLVVPGIRRALERTTAVRLFVCNVATQVGETEEFTLADHLAALAAHGLGDVIDAVLVNNNPHARQPANYPAAPVQVDLPLSSPDRPQVISRDVVDDGNAHHHDARKLATAILELHDERGIASRRSVLAR